MATNTGKVVGARLPMTDYLAVVTKAAELKMTVSDFVLLKLFAPPNPDTERLQQANQQIQHLKAQLTDLERTNTQLARNVNMWKDTADSLQIDHDNLQKERDQATSRVQQFTQERAQQQALVQTVTQQRQTAQDQLVALQKRVQGLHAALTQADEDASTRLGQLSDKHWAIINRFIKL